MFSKSRSGAFAITGTAFLLLMLGLWRVFIVERRAAEPTRETTTESREGSSLADRQTASDDLNAPTVDSGRTPTDSVSSERFLEGVVVDEAENPIAGAEISIPSDHDKSRQPMVSSDANGHFRLAIEKETYPAIVVVFHPDYRPRSVPLTDATTGVGSNPLHIVLYRGATICLLVADEYGMPVPGALVSSCLDNGSGYGTFIGSESDQMAYNRLLYSHGVEAHTRRSDSAGSACISGVSEGRHIVSIRADGFTPLDEAITIDIADKQHIDLGTVVLRRGWRIVCRAISSDGYPVGGVNAKGLFSLVYHDTQADQSGNFVLGDFPQTPTTGELLLEHPEYSPLWLQVELSGSQDVDVTLERRTLSVHLFDPVGRPVRGDVKVELVCPENALLLREERDATMQPQDGLITFTLLGSFVRSISIAQEHYLPAVVDLGGPSWSDVREEEVHFEFGPDDLVLQLFDMSGKQIDAQADLLFVGQETTEDGLLLVSNIEFKSEPDEDGYYRVPLVELPREDTQEVTMTVKVAGFSRSNVVLISAAHADPVPGLLTVWLTTGDDSE